LEMSSIMHHWLLTTTSGRLLLCSFGIVDCWVFTAQCAISSVLSTYLCSGSVEDSSAMWKIWETIISWHTLYWNLARCIWFYLLLVVFTQELISMNFVSICFCSFAMFF
jgi:hypothetical protein